MDFSTIKNELFPVIAAVFSKTSSLGIKVRGLEAFVVLCGGSNDASANNDGLDGIANKSSKKSSSTALDKYTMQEKIVPLIKGIKTKEPAVALAALNVLRQVGTVVDADFVAMDVLPVLWSMSLGPLLNLQQFQAFMELIKSLSARVESEQSRKLQDLAGSNGHIKSNDDFMSFTGPSAFASSSSAAGEGGDVDFEALVKGNLTSRGSSNALDSSWDATPNTASQQTYSAPAQRAATPSFSWSTPDPIPQPSSTNLNTIGSIRPQQAQNPTSRTITPDLSRFDALTPASTQFSQPLQPLQPQQSSYGFPTSQTQGTFSTPQFPAQQPSYSSQQPLQPSQPQSYQTTNTSINWGAAASNPWSSNTSPLSPPPNNSLSHIGNSMSSLSMNQQQQPRPQIGSQTSSFSLPPPPGASAFKAPAQQQYSYGSGTSGFGGTQSAFQASQTQQNQKKTGLDAYESLI